MALAVRKEIEEAVADGAKEANLSVTEFVEEALIEKLEDIHDIKVYEDYLERKKRGEVKYYTTEELAKELDIEI
jgi:predicted DNA-binding protein